MLFLNVKLLLNAESIPSERFCWTHLFVNSPLFPQTRTTRKMADEDFTKDETVSNGSFVKAEAEASQQPTESNGGDEHESDANKESSDLGKTSKQHKMIQKVSQNRNSSQSTKH